MLPLVIIGCYFLLSAFSLPPEIHNKDKYKHIIVVPSLSFDHDQLAKIRGYQALEERFLYELLALTNKKTRVTFITSMPVSEAIVEYYLRLVQLVTNESANKIRRERLRMWTAFNDEPIPLARKILENKSLLGRLCVNKSKHTILSVFKASKYEWKLAERLQVNLLAAAPDLQKFGTKSGSRTIFRDVRIPHSSGTYAPVFHENLLIEEIIKVVKRNPSARKGIVKLEDAFSGKGNAVIDLSAVSKALKHTSILTSFLLKVLIKKALRKAKLFSENGSWESFKAEMQTMGAVFELFIEADDGVPKAPSVQLFIESAGQVQVLSTHDQILADDGQTYLGCTFPAHVEYRGDIIANALKVGVSLAKKGVRGYLGIDFLAIRNKDGRWLSYALEINLRKTGTTHPFMILQYLTGGEMDSRQGKYIVKVGNEVEERYYKAVDSVHDPLFHNLSPYDLVSFADGSKSIHYSNESKKGIVFTKMNMISKYAHFGMVAIGASPGEAGFIFNDALQQLRNLANMKIEN